MTDTKWLIALSGLLIFLPIHAAPVQSAPGSGVNHGSASFSGGYRGYAVPGYARGSRYPSSYYGHACAYNPYYGGYTVIYSSSYYDNGGGNVYSPDYVAAPPPPSGPPTPPPVSDAPAATSGPLPTGLLDVNGYIHSPFTNSVFKVPNITSGQKVFDPMTGQAFRVR